MSEPDICRQWADYFQRFPRSQSTLARAERALTPRPGDPDLVEVEWDLAGPSGEWEPYEIACRVGLDGTVDIRVANGPDRIEGAAAWERMPAGEEDLFLAAALLERARQGARERR